MKHSKVQNVLNWFVYLEYYHYTLSEREWTMLKMSSAAQTSKKVIDQKHVFSTLPKYAKIKESVMHIVQVIEHLMQDKGYVFTLLKDYAYFSFRIPQKINV